MDGLTQVVAKKPEVRMTQIAITPALLGKASDAPEVQALLDEPHTCPPLHSLQHGPGRDDAVGLAALAPHHGVHEVLGKDRTTFLGINFLFGQVLRRYIFSSV